MQPRSAPSRRSRVSAIWPIATSIAGTIAILGIATALMLELRANVGVRARETSENLLRLIERDIARNFQVLDLSLLALRDGLSRPDVMSAPPEVRDRVLFNRAAAATSLAAVAAADARGRITASTAPVPADLRSVEDREYFQAHLSGEHDRLHISRPHYSRALDKAVVAVSRRLTNSDGSFGGVVLASTELAYFADLVSKLQLGRNGVITLFRKDGAILHRQTAQPQQPLESLAGSGALDRIAGRHSGSFVGTSGIDGVERLYTFTHVGDLPLVVSVGLATEDVYERFRSQSVLVSVILFVICLGLIALTARLSRELRRREIAERALVVSNSELARLSLTDALTGLGNRRAFDEGLARELRHAGRARRKLTLVLVDIDYFKAYNDRYGHAQGDATLASVARALAASCGRPADTAYRLGGEEFAVLLPETGTEGAARVAERIRMAVHGLQEPHSGSRFGCVTVSLGFAEIQGSDPASAYERTDTALYAAKQAGRDRACPAPRRLIAA